MMNKANFQQITVAYHTKLDAVVGIGLVEHKVLKKGNSSVGGVKKTSWQNI